MRLLLLLFLLFVLTPLVELTLLLILAEWTHWTYTLLLVIVTGIAGSLLARSQGWRTYRRIQQELSQGRMPADSVLDAVLIFCAGALLLTPGMLTDAVGLSLLIPPCRRLYRVAVLRWLRSRFQFQPLTGADSDLPGSRAEIIDSYVVTPPGGQRGAAGGGAEGDESR